MTIISETANCGGEETGAVHLFLLLIQYPGLLFRLVYCSLVFGWLRWHKISWNGMIVMTGGLYEVEW